ncbi:MAG: glycosyltransferase [Actinomycetaceae bacterium]|nr:glycosyltransferase [Actinomycetaceae bacterium]
MKIALNVGVFNLPGHYFVVDHALRLSNSYESQVFALMATLRDNPGLPVHLPAHKLKASILRTSALPLLMLSTSRAIRDWKPDVIHQHFGTWSLPAVHAAKPRATTGSTPMLTTLHGYDAFSLVPNGPSAIQSWHAHNVRAAAKTSRLLLPVSRYLADIAIHAGLPASKLEVLYLGVDTEEFHPATSHKRQAPINSPSEIILSVGNLAENKGVRDIVAAFKALPPAPPNSSRQLRFIGDGPLRPWLQQQATLDARIQVLGRLPRPAVVKEMQNAHLLVMASLPYRGRRESAGLVLLEAQACATPVVAYASGGTPEMLGEDHNSRQHPGGFSVPEGDQQELGRQIHNVLTMDALSYHELCSQARAWVTKHRNIQNSTATLAEIYSQIS